MERLYLKYEFGQIGPKITASSNSHTSQFEDNECKYDMIKGFLHSNRH